MRFLSSSVEISGVRFTSHVAVRRPVVVPLLVSLVVSLLLTGAPVLLASCVWLLASSRLYLLALGFWTTGYSRRIGGLGVPSPHL
jgi:hypothetical protein